MKRNSRYGSIFIVLVLLLFSCKNKTSEHEGHQNMPGMEMDSMGVQADTMTMDEHSSMQHTGVNSDATPQHQSTVNTSNLKVNDLLMPSNQSVISQITTVKPERKTLAPLITAQGILDYDQRRFTNVAARVNGRMEKLYVKYNFQKVNKGQKLFEIYSPELVNAQNDFIFLLDGNNGNNSVLQSAEKKLELLGLNQEQIRNLRSAKKTTLTFPVVCPQDGYLVLEDDNSQTTSSASAANSSSGMSGMGSSSSPSVSETMPTSSLLSVKEGAYVLKGQTVFRIVNTDVLWALIKIFRQDVSGIKLGDKVDLKIENYPDKISARVDFIQQFYKTDDKTVTVRVYVKNPSRSYRVGNLVTAEINGEEISALWIPTQSVVDLGNQQIVFIKKGNLFQTMRIKTGRRVQNHIEVLEGLNEEMEIASNSQYLVDSEAFIKTK